MTTTICNCCGEVIHGSPDPSSIEEWYRTHHPDLPIGSVVPGLCFDCSQTYEIGSMVVSRDPNDEMVYTVQRVIPYKEFPPLLEVIATDSHVRHFAASRMRAYLAPFESSQPPCVSKSGYF